jgi:hypothetical protein
LAAGSLFPRPSIPGVLTLSQQREILGFIPVWCEKALKSGDGVAAVHEVFDYTVKKYLEAAK